MLLRKVWRESGGIQRTDRSEQRAQRRRSLRDFSRSLPFAMDFAESHGANVFGTGTLGALAFFVFDRLTFLQLLDGGIDQRGVVEENFPTVACDKTKTLVRNNLLNRTLCHCGYLQ